MWNLINLLPAGVYSSFGYSELPKSVYKPPIFSMLFTFNGLKNIFTQNIQAIQISQRNKIMIHSVFYFSVVPKFCRWIPVKPDNILCAYFKLVINFIRNVIGLIDKQPITPRPMCFP